MVAFKYFHDMLQVNLFGIIRIHVTSNLYGKHGVYIQLYTRCDLLKYIMVLCTHISNMCCQYAKHQI